MAYRSIEVYLHHINESNISRLLVVFINFQISTSVTSLTCIIVSKFQYLALCFLLGLYLVVILMTMITALLCVTQLLIASEQFLKEKHQFKRRQGKQFSYSCQVLCFKVGDFHTINVMVMGIVLEAVANYTVTLLLNIKTLN